MLKIVSGRGRGSAGPAPDGAVVTLQQVTRTYGRGPARCTRCAR